MSKIVNTYCPSFPVFGRNMPEGATLMAVLTEDAAGKFAVYAGYVCLPQSGEEAYREVKDRHANAIAGSGQKLNLTMARAFFPNLTEEVYRR